MHVSRDFLEILHLLTEFSSLLLSRRSELDLLPAPPQPALNPSTEEMYSHLQAQHPESLALGEQDWKADLLEMGPPRNQ